MCGRYTLFQQQWIDSLLTGLAADGRDALSRPRYNVAPGQLVLALRRSGETFKPAAMHWGIAAPWPGGPSRVINARDDKLTTSRLWKSLLTDGRCAIAADGFYEWRKLEDGRKQPYWFGATDDQRLAFAGLCDADDQHGQSCVIITVAANELVEGVHDRMPAMLDADGIDAWLTGDTDEALAALQPFPSARMTARPVSRAVNGVSRDGPELVQAVEPDGPAPVAKPPEQQLF